MRHPSTQPLRTVTAALLILLATACQHKLRYVYTERGTGAVNAPATAESLRVECPKCYRLLVCCRGNEFSVDGAPAAQGVAWACPVHGYVATTPDADVRHKTCAHGIGKAPARIVDPQGAFPPAVFLRCKSCGAGGVLILEQKGQSQTFYCAD